MKRYNVDFEVSRMFDNFLFTLWSISRSRKFCMADVVGKDSEDYRFIVKDGSLFGSILLLGFISKNYNDICLKPYERGRAFENFVERELRARNVKILKKNLETPEGEIDFICDKRGKISFIEVKDYGPWFDENYISSRTYSERVNAINDRLKYALPRLQWVNSNRSLLGLTPYQKIKGIILTRFYEPHLKIPSSFNYISIDQINRVFGKPNYVEIHKARLKFKIKEEKLLELEKEFKKTEDYKRFGLR